MLKDVRERYGFFAFCELCGERCRDVLYYCDVCHSGNYDLCHRYLVRGEHCLDRNHLLAKQDLKALANKKFGEKVSYYSSVNKEGERDVSLSSLLHVSTSIL